MRRVGVLFALSSIACSTGTVPRDAGSFDATIPFEAGAQCGGDYDCDDHVACTIDECAGELCAHRPCLDCCDEGLVCVVCFGCRMEPTPCTTDEECLDSVRCTLDYCRGGTSCAHDPQPGLCDEGEICLPAVGCIPEPPSSCTSAEDCETTGAFCVGRWSCQPEFGCQFVSRRSGDDGDECTVDGCDEELGACVNAPMDADGDGHAPAGCGNDCDDGDAAIHGGAIEVCDGATDEDCDGAIDEGCCEEDLPCPTSCGSTGRTLCEDGVMRCVPPAEVCNGADDDCDGAPDEDFECVVGASEGCASSCGTTGAHSCGPTCAWGECVPPAETCNAVDVDCVGDGDEGFACIAGTSSACPTMCGSTGSRVCLGDCSFDTCVPPAETCNGVDDDCDTACDDGFTCCSGSTRSCTTLGFFAGSATCRADCGGWDTAGCTNCGNGTLDSGEQCDGASLGGATCTSVGMGFGSGTLRCAAGCMFDTSSCSRCGNGVVDAGEECDGTDLGGATCASVSSSFGGGTLRCSPSCSFDTGMCRTADASGVYTVTPAPAYMCAFGLVNFNLTALVFADGGSSMTVNGAPCSMIGTSPRATGTFDVSCSIPGTCTETYRLTGTFTGPDTWTGTFTATFTGGSSCLTCMNRTFAGLTGMR